MWLNRKYYNGLSVLPFSDHSYKQAPFEDCTKEEYEQLLPDLHSVNLDLVREEQDETSLQGELACAGGSCEIFLKNYLTNHLQRIIILVRWFFYGGNMNFEPMNRHLLIEPIEENQEQEN